MPGAAVLMVRQSGNGRVQRVASTGWPQPYASDSSAAPAALETSP
jgi:hypothetical protein